MQNPVEGERGVRKLIEFNRPAVQALTTFFTSLAILLTVARLTRRFRIRRLSWDDAWAALGMVLIAGYLGAYWEGDKQFTNQQPPDINEYKNRFRTWSQIMMGLYTAIVWCSRISLALSIARILPPSRLRKSTVCLAIFCFLAGVSLTLIKVFLCKAIYEPQSNPTTLAATNYCPRPTGTFLIAFQTTSDVLSSVLLVAIPIYFLRSTDLPTPERRLILMLFTSTVLALVVCILHAVLILQNSRGMVFSTQLEASMSLIVCNLIVVVTAVYRLLPCQKSTYDTTSFPETTRPRSCYNTGEDPVTVLTWTQQTTHPNSSQDTQGFESRTFELTETSDHQYRHSLDRCSAFTELEESRTNSLRSIDLADSWSTN
ncbi:hypothetical protein PM082_001583 [Marasmius tenuissimus]|nr:hypothetical protein PM082_001583 [Marasmius tenuissimus]